MYASSGTTGGAGVVVWEWLNEFGRWTPYTPAVSAYIEKQHNQQANVQLGTVDANLSAYTIDTRRMVQIRQDTGTARNVRRSQYQATSTAAIGVLWQWTGDIPNQWNSYDIEVADILENANINNMPSVDLAQQPCQLPYTVNLRLMTQTRQGSGFVRHVRRIQTATPYSSAAKGSGTVKSSGSSAYLKPGQSGGAIKKKSSSLSNGHSTVPPKMTRQTVRNLRLASQLHAIAQQGSTNAYGTSGATYGSSAQSLSQQPASGSPYSQITNFANAVVNAIGSIPASVSGYNPYPPNVYGVNQPGPVASTTSSTSVSNAAAASSSTSNDDAATGVLKKYVIIQADPPDDEDCCICCDSLKSSGLSDNNDDGADPVYKLNKCDHMFHKSCLVAMYNSGPKNGSIQCPTCKKMYGEKTGICPPGRMDVQKIPRPLAGYESCGTIQITYHIPTGIQGPEHPNPGQHYSTRGFPRSGYLPDNKQGRKVLKLLRKAWDRRLTFTIGTSVTTGEPNTVVWNEIHHKTEFVGNHSGHGYPDPNYLDNVTMELNLQGVTDSDDERE